MRSLDDPDYGHILAVVVTGLAWVVGMVLLERYVWLRVFPRRQVVWGDDGVWIGRRQIAINHIRQLTLAESLGLVSVRLTGLGGHYTLTSNTLDLAMTEEIVELWAKHHHISVVRRGRWGWL